MPTLKQTLLETIDAKDIAQLAQWTETNYRDDQAVPEAYGSVLRLPSNVSDTDDFLERVYKALEAFGMNSRMAELTGRTTFNTSVKEHADTILSLAKYNLETVENVDGAFTDTIGFLFDRLQLSQTESRLVTFAKAMHFFLPDLFMPIDGRYTLRFFYESKPINEKQCFLQVFEQFRQFAHEHYETLKAQVDKTSHWNRNIPKIIDNIIIAYVSAKME
jgi:hypothetical protein